MKKMLALAIATALASPIALADNPPSNVGDVTYLGNIVANSPMWQWTVNDYPGGRLDAKPSEVVEVNGTYTYPLNGQAFIAASGYLPSFVGISVASGSSSTLGTRDITTLTDQNGTAPSDITDAEKGAVTFAIAASGYDSSGQAVEGKLKLKATELRATRYALYTARTSGGTPIKDTKATLVYGANSPVLSLSPGDSCFIGTGSYSSNGGVASGTADNPTKGEQSDTSFNALLSALAIADTAGNAPSYSSLTDFMYNNTFSQPAYCVLQTVSPTLSPATSTASYIYMSGAHILELTPVELQFSAPLSGTWNSTLTVTAYTM
ncbi:hypothetical protein [Providencia rettgeri]|uniref:hypothetical protein n=1 Tax=Providencia rettgeri TaxID=587 RepID=UPI00235FEAE2|nr:hypothetical protein [Providencia rettgeri]